AFDHRPRQVVHNDATFPEKQHPLAKLFDDAQLMTYTKNRSPGPADLLHLSKALLLILSIAHVKYCILNQDLRFHMRRDSNSQADIHAGTVTFDGCVEKLLNVSKGHNLVTPPFYLHLGHPQNGTIEKDVLAPRQLWVKSGTYLQKTRDPSFNANPPRCGICNPAKDFE